MKWTDIQDIAVELAEAHPDVDPKSVRFTELYEWVQQLPGFDDDRGRRVVRLEFVEVRQAVPASA
jgi:FeS assembly protein IscX